MMNQINDIELTRKEALTLYQKAQGFIKDEQYLSASIALEKCIIKFEKVYGGTRNTADKRLLYDLYNESAKVKFQCYQITANQDELYPCRNFYEKIIILLEDDIKHIKEGLIDLYHDILEAYVHVLWIAAELNDNKTYEIYISRCEKNAKKLLKYANTYENQEYIILCNIFRGDYYRGKEKRLKAFYYYYLAQRKLEKIYENYTVEAVKNDLILIYDNLAKLTLNLKFYNLRKYYETKLKTIKEVKHETLE